ncbi:hypothetical protein [uncultured Amnibacterium sp.]|uniref:hypothetical protein n=1 Tax=uncultured Amnibacterium sp. TaxID=1631851 RepID=UPI0035CC32EB
MAVQPIAVGRREGLDAYLRAARNLGRDPTAADIEASSGEERQTLAALTFHRP